MSDADDANELAGRLFEEAVRDSAEERARFADRLQALADLYNPRMPPRYQLVVMTPPTGGAPRIELSYTPEKATETEA